MRATPNGSALTSLGPKCNSVTLPENIIQSKTTYLALLHITLLLCLKLYLYSEQYSYSLKCECLMFRMTRIIQISLQAPCQLNYVAKEHKHTPGSCTHVNSTESWKMELLNKICTTYILKNCF